MLRHHLSHHQLVFDFSKGTYMPDPDIGFVLRPGVTTSIGVLGKKMSVNSLGFRGPELPQESRQDRIRDGSNGTRSWQG